MSSQSNTEKQRPINFKKEIANLRKINERLKYQIEDEKRKMKIEKESTNQLELRARELNAEREQVQKQINNAPEEFKKCFDEFKRSFRVQQLFFKQELKNIKDETSRINRLTEIAVLNLQDLQKQINMEFVQLQKIDLQEKNELDGAEEELKRLESEELRLLKLLLCPNSRTDQFEFTFPSITIERQLLMPPRRPKPDNYEGPMHKLKSLKERLERKIYQGESCDYTNFT